VKNCPECSATYPDEYIVCPKDGSRLVSGSPWEVNSVIRGKYKILGKIGQGGMAIVYRAHHQLLDEPRALKVINPELARDELFVKRFKNEAINTRKLQHPNAVRVDDLDIAEDGRPFIAMEMVGGESLKDLVQHSGPMPYTHVVEIASQVCEALGAAHKLGLTHRDIKPDNIVLLRGRDLKLVVKILDFGIASLKESRGGDSNTLTGTGVVIGTPDYMSPEQAMGKRGEEIDGRSDIYSLGIVMYRMLTGELPFKANTTVEMILHHVQDVPPAPQQLKPQLGIPSSISAIVMKALEKNPDNRFAAAPAMGTALRLALASAARAVAVPSPVLATVKTGPASVAPPPAPATAPKARPSRPQPAAPPVVAPKPQAPPPRAVTPPRPAPAMRPVVRPVKQQKRFPIYQSAAGVAVLAVLALGAMRLMRRQPTAPEVKPAESAPGTSASPRPAQRSRSTARKTAAPTGNSSNLHTTSSPEGKTGSDLGSVPTPLASPEKTPAGQPASSGTGASKSTTTSADTGKEKKLSPGTPEERGRGQKSQSTTGIEPSPKQQAKKQQSQEERAAEIIRQDIQQQPEEKAAEIMRRDMQSQVRPMNDRATQLFNNGMYKRAAQIYRQVLEIAPNNIRAQSGLKKCLEKIREMQ
jgi:serine/threonine protein kinase